ncbi:hypothetical protein [Desulforhopalus singaporensis]|uniref:Uncharacterized protein n=1 Tax=Desulforhopalus singaporensis TaxID=91360 RepID=A0A1H0RLX5_9BACT|nr:hypothetical protein [Desulforhopalus singaporensis]SDP30511.1 hypothetical protein SAMN05660330_02369 [Desulforhopalus singaporensis]
MASSIRKTRKFSAKYSRHTPEHKARVQHIFRTVSDTAMATAADPVPHGTTSAWDKPCLSGRGYLFYQQRARRKTGRLHSGG